MMLQGCRHLIVIATAAALCASLGACSKKSADEGGDTSTLSGSLALVTGKMNKLDALLPDNPATLQADSLLRSAGEPISTMGAMSDVWTTGWMAHPMCSGGVSDPHCGSTPPVTLKEWMGYQIDPQAARDNGSSINVFGRLKTGFDSICAMGTMLSTGSDGLPSVGSQSFTFTADAVSRLATICGMNASGMTGKAVTAVVTTPSDTTYYDRKVAISLDSGTMTMFLRYGASGINVAMGESYTTQFSRTLVAYDPTTGVVRAEYVSASHPGSNDGGEFGRLYYDSNNDNGAIFYSTHDYGGTPNRLVYSLRGKANSGTEVAFSARGQGFGLSAVGDGSYGWNTILKACVNQSTGNIATADTVSCAGGVTGTAADDAGFASVITDIYSSTDAAHYTSYMSAGVYNETLHVPFTTAAEVYSVNATH